MKVTAKYFAKVLKVGQDFPLRDVISEGRSSNERERIDAKRLSKRGWTTIICHPSSQIVSPIILLLQHKLFHQYPVYQNINNSSVI